MNILKYEKITSLTKTRTKVVNKNVSKQIFTRYANKGISLGLLYTKTAYYAEMVFKIPFQ